MFRGDESLSIGTSNEKCTVSNVVLGRDVSVNEFPAKTATYYHPGGK